MSNFRILILAFLVVVLAVLGMIYVNISSRMDVIQQQQQMASAPAPVNPSPYLPMPTQAPASAVQPVVVADPVVSEELAHVSAELERMKKENEELKKRHALAEEERDLLERQNMEKGDPRLQCISHFLPVGGIVFCNSAHLSVYRIRWQRCHAASAVLFGKNH